MLASYDREQIAQLMARYFQLVEAREFDEWVACYTEDAIHEAGGVEYHGREAIRNFVAGAMPDGALIHLMGASTLTGDDRTARGVTVYATILVASDSTIRLRSAGRYHDTFRLVDGTWLFSEHRNLRLG